MKRFIIPILLSALFVVSAQAQDKKIEFSLKGGYGYNMPNPQTITLFNSHGVHFGPMMTFNFNESFGIQSGLQYNFFSATYLLDTESLKKGGTYKQHQTQSQYLDIPLRLQYRVPLTDELSACVFGGPNFSNALSRKTFIERFQDHTMMSAYPQLVKDFYTSDNTYSPLDVQFGVGATLQYLKYSISVSYDWGLTDKDKSVSKYKENNIKISFAYTF